VGGRLGERRGKEGWAAWDTRDVGGSSVELEGGGSFSKLGQI